MLYCVYVYSYEGLRSMLYQLQNEMIMLTGQVECVALCMYMYVICMRKYTCIVCFIPGPIECQRLVT